MPLEDFRRLVGAVRLPLALLSVTGEVLIANRAARELSEGLTGGGSFGQALAEPAPPVADLLRRWSRLGSPVPARLTLRGRKGPVECRADVARIDVAGAPALLVLFRQDDRGQFARLNDQLDRLRQEVRYRRVVEQERASALQAEQAARGRLERLQALTAALASALSTEDVLAAIMEFGAAAAGADGVVVRLADSSATDALSAGTPAPVAGLADARSAGDTPLAAALRARGPEFFATREELEGRYPDACRTVGTDRPYLAAAVPLRISADAAPLGVLGTVCRHGRELAPDGRVTAGIVASLCAQALERARLHDQERRFAETLQRALLPERLPEFGGIDVAVRYMPASETVAVGGDWYDVIALEGHLLGLVVGDVAGHGPGAATAMAQVRNALRALATTAASPADALSALNAYLCAQLPDEMATVVFVLVDRAAGVVRYANAGHLPPLLLPGEARPVYLQEGLGPPVGVEPGTRYRNSTVAIGPTSSIVIYTDGLVERRDEPIDLGLRRLARAVGGGPAEPGPGAEQLCEQVVDRLVGGVALTDDAVVVVADLAARLAATGGAGEASEAARTAAGADPRRLEAHDRPGRLTDRSRPGGEDGVEVDLGHGLEPKVGVAHPARRPDAHGAHAGGQRRVHPGGGVLEDGARGRLDAE